MTARKILDLRDRRARFRPGRTSTVSRQEEKPTPLHTRRRRRRLIIAGIALFMITLSVYGTSWLTHVPQLSINTITIVGARDISARSVEQYVRAILDDPTWHYVSQKNIFFYDGAAIEGGLVRDIPRVKLAHLSRPSELSQTLVVAIVERQPAALWCVAGNACYGMDDTGFIFADASTATTSSYTFRGGVATSSSPIGHIFAYGHMPDIRALVEALREAGFAAGGVTVESTYDMTVHLIKGYDIKASFGEGSDVLVRNLQLVLASDALKGKETNLAYVDLRFGNRVYYKMKGVATVQSSGN